MREEFQIPHDVELVVHGLNDLHSRPSPEHITLSMEFLRASLCLPFHPFLRWVLQRLNVALMQLKANAYRILISCFVLWMKYLYVELPFSMFQNLYRMKTAPSSTYLYYSKVTRGCSSLVAQTQIRITGICGSTQLTSGCLVGITIGRCRLRSACLLPLEGITLDPGAPHRVQKPGEDREVMGEDKHLVEL